MKTNYKELIFNNYLLNYKLIGGTLKKDANLDANLISDITEKITDKTAIALNPSISSL